MKAVITGDVIGSTNVSPQSWLDSLKEVLSKYGKESIDWEIFRGDSFQLLLSDASDALVAAVAIKALMKSIETLDVRMAIGLGTVSYIANRIPESNGEAFVFSGEKFEQLKKDKINLAMKSTSKTFDRDMNLYIKFALIAMDHWTENSAEMVKLTIDHSDKSQQELGKMIDIKQNAVSERLRRAHYDVIQDLLAIYLIKLKELHGIAA